MRAYKCLEKQIYQNNEYTIVPIRDEDKYNIMEWRNEQIYHLRQTETLTKEKQEWYFKEVVAKLFDQQNPSQILFSYLENGKCIGYGGLVHINWVDKNAEISFLIDTQLEKERFEFHWLNYLTLIESVAFKDLKLHKIFTYAFDLRPLLYKILANSGFTQEARLQEHCYFDNKYIDILIHSKFNLELFARKATIEDVKLFFHWANDDKVRRQSFNSTPIDWISHQKWFKNKIKYDACLLLVFETYNGEPVGQVRFEKDEQTMSSVIGISISEEFRGKKLASQLISKASIFFINENPNYIIKAYIKKDNLSSVKSFEGAGYTFGESLNYCGFDSLLYLKMNL